MMKDKVSIVIPAYNAANYLAEAIDSALAQTYSNIEVIVVNDGSNDDGATEKIALSYGDRIRYFRKENGGSSSALNYGIRNMTGTWFSWLSHDDLYYPDKVEKQMECLQTMNIAKEERFLHIFFSGADLIDANGDLIKKPTKKAMCAREKKIEHLPGNEYLIARPTEYIFHGCTCLLHKDIFMQVGFFDESLRLLNDVDMWYRLYSYGCSLHYVPQVLVSGRIHHMQISRSIGFSYHNPEQDMYWRRSLEWLKDNHPNKYELFLLFGKNAYIKTRFAEGEMAFTIARKLCPSLTPCIKVLKIVLYLYAKGRSLAKDLYLKLKV